MKNNAILFVVLAGLLAGCADRPIPDVATHYNQFTGARTDLIPENLLEGGDPVREMVWLNASRVFRSPQEFSYYLDVHYEAMEETGFLDLPPGETLIIVADGREYKLTGSGTANSRRVIRGIAVENAIYPVPAEVLLAIAAADEVVVKLVGRNGIVIREFQPENFERFRKFVANFVEPE